MFCVTRPTEIWKNNASSVRVCKYELGGHILMHPYVHGWMYRVCWNTLFSSKPKAPQLERGWWGGSRPLPAWPTYQLAVCGNLLHLRIDLRGRCLFVCSASSIDCLFLLLLLLDVESQWLHEQCRLRTADKPAGYRVKSPKGDPDVCVWTLSRNVSIRRQFNIFF